MPLLWWWKKPAYRRYMWRELSALFIGVYTLVLIAGLFCLAVGERAWAAYLAVLRTPAALIGQIAVLGFVLYHAVTWFHLAPASMPLWIGSRRVAARWITLGHYLLWLLISGSVLWGIIG